MGFDDHHARTLTDLVDNDPKMPDALESRRKARRGICQDREASGTLAWHCLCTERSVLHDRDALHSGADVFYANDRPPFDSTFVKRLKDAGAIILAKANLSEYADGIPRSSFGGTFGNPYDTERNPGVSSAGSGSAVGANLVTCAIAEETGGSVRGPAQKNSCVGIAGTEELVPRFWDASKRVSRRASVPSRAPSRTAPCSPGDCGV